MGNRPHRDNGEGVASGLPLTLYQHISPGQSDVVLATERRPGNWNLASSKP